jgi:hypothetical protein
VPAKAPSDQRPTANGQQHPHHHGRCRQKCPPSATLKAKKTATMRSIDGGRHPEQANMLFSGNEPVSSPQNAPMVRQNSSPSLLHHRSILRALDRLIAGKKQICLLGALSQINPTHMRLKLDFICGSRGPFPGAAAMVVVLVVSLWQAWKAY